MKRWARLLVNVTVWSALAFVAGVNLGYQQGYGHGVRDISTLVIVLHDAAGGPIDVPTKRDTAWGLP